MLFSFQTRIVITNNLQYLHNFDQIIVMQNGVIAQTGKMKSLVNGERQLLHKICTAANEGDSVTPYNDSMRSFVILSEIFSKKVLFLTLLCTEKIQAISLTNRYKSKDNKFCLSLR